MTPEDIAAANRREGQRQREAGLAYFPDQQPAKPRRSRKTAKDAGSRFAQCIADGFNALLGTDTVERRTERGALDRGDIAGLRDSYGRRIVVECKDFGGRIETAGPLAEAEVEAENDGAHVGVVAMKRRGIGYANPGAQLIVMTVEDLAKLLKAPEDRNA